MEKTFDFNTIGKRMPYSVPDGFFDRMEENVMDEVNEELRMKNEEFLETFGTSDQGRAATATSGKPKSSKKAVTIALRSLLAVAAAALALFFVVRATIPKSAPILALADEYAGVEQAFDNLSTDDQEFLITIYEDEEYINDLTDYDEDL